MARRKTTKEQDPIHDVYVLQDDDEQEDDQTVIETQAMMDWIEYDIEEEEDDKRHARRTCRVTFHVDLPEHIAQHLFADYVKDGRMTIEFQPLAANLRRRDPLVHS
jgi:hypothetical protein